MNRAETNFAVSMRRANSALRKTIRKFERDSLKGLGLAFEESNNPGIVYVSTSKGTAAYVLATGSWKINDQCGRGAKALKEYHEIQGQGLRTFGCRFDG